LADLPPSSTDARHEVEDPGREAGVVDDLGQDEGVQGRHFRRLEHHGAAGGQRRGHLGHDLVERVVPGGDGADDPDRLLHHQAVADLLLESEVAQHLGVVADLGGGQADLDHGRQLDRHPDLGGDELGQLRLPGRQALLDTLEVLGPLLGGGGRPGRKGGLGGGDGPVDVGGDAIGDPADDLLGGGAVDVDGAGAAGGNPRPVDIDGVALDHGDLLSSPDRRNSPLECCRWMTASSERAGVSRSTAPRCGSCARPVATFPNIKRCGRGTASSRCARRLR
jgi:hypothetical protein